MVIQQSYARCIRHDEQFRDETEQDNNQEGNEKGDSDTKDLNDILNDVLLHNGGILV